MELILGNVLEGVNPENLSSRAMWNKINAIIDVDQEAARSFAGVMVHPTLKGKTKQEIIEGLKQRGGDLIRTSVMTGHLETCLDCGKHYVAGSIELERVMPDDSTQNPYIERGPNYTRVTSFVDAINWKRKRKDQRTFSIPAAVGHAMQIHNSCAARFRAPASEDYPVLVNKTSSINPHELKTFLGV